MESMLFFEQILKPFLIDNQFNDICDELETYIQHTFVQIKKEHIKMFTTRDFFDDGMPGFVISDKRKEFAAAMNRFIAIHFKGEQMS